MRGLAERLAGEGLDASSWSKGPGDADAAHAHAHDNVLVSAQGSLRRAPRPETTGTARAYR